MTATVRDLGPEMARMQPALALVDALMGGTFAMRAAGKAHLPQWPAEEPESWRMRLDTATLFPAYARTVSVLAGKPFSKSVTTTDDLAPAVADLLFDVDLEGRNLHAFAAALMEDALARGMAGILVDCPPNPGARSVAEERAAGLRPYWVHVRAGDILGWRAERRGGARVLTQLRLLETVDEPDGPWGSRCVPQVRVLEPGQWSTWRQRDDAKREWVLHAEGVTTLDVIPFVPVYGRRLGYMHGEPPMLELAHANVEHWQGKSDQQTILHVARVPILFARGLGETTLAVGAGAFISSGAEHAELRYVEHSGAAIEAGRKSLLDLEDRMRQIGAELLVIKPGNTTVAQTVADNEPGMCDLQRITEAVEDALDTALALTAQWIGAPETGRVSLYKDFGAATLAEASAALLVALHGAGGLSHPTLINELKRRGILAPEVDPANERAAPAPAT